jgi:uncharacterized protein
VSRTVSLPIVAGNPRTECTDCAKCCTYVAAGIEPPDTIVDAGSMLWYLYHPGVSVYHDGNGDWSVVFESRCTHLRKDKLCGIYETRPPICRDFDNTTCDVNEPGEGLEFFKPEEFLSWLSVAKPRIFRVFRDKYMHQALPPAKVAVPPRLRRR